MDHGRVRPPSGRAAWPALQVATGGPAQQPAYSGMLVRPSPRLGQAAGPSAPQVQRHCLREPRRCEVDAILIANPTSPAHHYLGGPPGSKTASAPPTPRPARPPGGRRPRRNASLPQRNAVAGACLAQPAARAVHDPHPRRLELDRSPRSTRRLRVLTHGHPQGLPLPAGAAARDALAAATEPTPHAAAPAAVPSGYPYPRRRSGPGG